MEDNHRKYPFNLGEATKLKEAAVTAFANELSQQLEQFIIRHSDYAQERLKNTEASILYFYQTLKEKGPEDIVQLYKNHFQIKELKDGSIT